jgi:hypothetical protein
MLLLDDGNDDDDYCCLIIVTVETGIFVCWNIDARYAAYRFSFLNTGSQKYVWYKNESYISMAWSMIERKCVEKTQCTETGTKLLPRTYFNILTLPFSFFFSTSLHIIQQGPSEDLTVKLLFSIIAAVKHIYHENSINTTRRILSSLSVLTWWVEPGGGEVVAALVW